MNVAVLSIVENRGHQYYPFVIQPFFFMKISFLILGISFATFALCSNLRAGEITVIPIGFSSANSSDWITAGLATFDGKSVGLDPLVSLEPYSNGSTDLTFDGGYGQTSLPAADTIQWVDDGTEGQYAFGIVTGTTSDADLVLGIGSTFVADAEVGGSPYVIISEVAPRDGTYSLDGEAQTATAMGQILQWEATLADINAGDTFVFSGVDPSDIEAGPVGFSVPEPSTWAMLVASFLALTGFQVLRLRRR